MLHISNWNHRTTSCIFNFLQAHLAYENQNYTKSTFITKVMADEGVLIAQSSVRFIICVSDIST